MVAGIALGVVGLVLLVVAVQSPGAWKAAAEHSKRFWLLWAVVFVAAGLAPVAFTREVPTGGALAWLVACCALAAFQPSMFSDVRETRRHRRRVHAARAVRAARATASVDDAPFALPMRVPMAAPRLAAAPVPMNGSAPASMNGSAPAPDVVDAVAPIRWRAPLDGPAADSIPA